MSNEYEPMLRMLMAASNNNSSLKNIGKIAEIFKNPQDKADFQNLINQNPQLLKQIIASVMSNDKEGAKAILAKLMMTKEGARIASVIMSAMGE